MASADDSFCSSGEKVPCPVQRKVGAGLVDSQHTDVVITEFEHNVFVIATMMKKLGNLVEVSLESVIGEPTAVVYTSRILFGQDEPEIHAVARSLAEILKFPKPVIFSLTLFKYSTQIVKSLGELIQEVSRKPPILSEENK